MIRDCEDRFFKHSTIVNADRTNWQNDYWTTQALQFMIAKCTND